MTFHESTLDFWTRENIGVQGLGTGGQKLGVRDSI